MALQEVEEAARRGPVPIDPFAEPPEVANTSPWAEVEEAEKCDPLQGKRVHAWVLVLPGKRDVVVRRPIPEGGRERRWRGAVRC